MSVLTIPQALVYAKNAGFTGTGLARIVAIAMCESSLNTKPKDNINSDGSRDRGLYQINSRWHPEVSDACAYDPACSSTAAYNISNKGTSFTPWSTYNNGCSDRNMNAVLAQMNNTAGSLNTSPKLKAWYTFPRIDNLGGVEPFGGFPKPDSNIQVPDRYPITALLDGTVTAIDGGNVAWGGVITIKLDKPLNSLATHTAYLHLASELVVVGQHVNSGQLIAYNGGGAAQGSQKVPLGFALYNGDHYGADSSWGLMTKANLNGGPLDPVPLLNSVRDGTAIVGTDTQGVGFATIVQQKITSVSVVASQLVNEVPGFTGICEALDMVEQFVPFTLSSQGKTDVTTATQNTDVNVFGWDTGVTNPFAVAQSAQAAIALPADAMQAILVFTVTNFAAFAIRALFVICGLVLFYALIINLISSMVDVKDVASTVEKVAPLLM